MPRDASAVGFAPRPQTFLCPGAQQAAGMETCPTRATRDSHPREHRERGDSRANLCALRALPGESGFVGRLSIAAGTCPTRAARDSHPREHRERGDSRANLCALRALRGESGFVGRLSIAAATCPTRATRDSHPREHRERGDSRANLCALRALRGESGFVGRLSIAAETCPTLRAFHAAVHRPHQLPPKKIHAPRPIPHPI